jgi:hypothetical protein
MFSTYKMLFAQRKNVPILAFILFPPKFESPEIPKRDFRKRGYVLGQLSFGRVSQCHTFCRIVLLASYVLSVRHFVDFVL